ncbi:hypothetical protein ACIP6X_04415 [Streptomyces coeruleorubidus]|uniref:hypothetical protein n=1 Tax=Streptomyces coeruleorubidus TaxID=116188 RepID=UPI00380EB701
MAATHAGPGSPAEPDSAGFGSVVASTGPWNAEKLTLALHQATTYLGGLGALIHWRPAAGRMLLAAADELAPGIAGTWAELREEQEVAPTNAVRRGAFVWMKGDHLGIGAGGTASVPLLGSDGRSVGALSVLVAAESGEPDGVRQSFLRSVAAWVAAHREGLSGTPPGRGPVAEPERAVLMGELTTALAEALTSAEVLAVVAEHILPPLGADGLGIDVLEGGRLRLVGIVGHPPGFARKLGERPLSSGTVEAEVLRTRTLRGS